MQSFPGYKLVELDSGKQLIVDCSASQIGDCIPVNSIRAHLGGCPVFEQDYFESESLDEIPSNVSICRKKGDKLYIVPLHKASNKEPSEDYFAGKIIKTEESRPKESAVELYYHVYKRICDDARLQELDAGQYMINLHEIKKILPEIEADLEARGLLGAAQFHAATKMFPDFEKAMQEK